MAALTRLRTDNPSHRKQKITLGEMRAGRGGTRGLLVYCKNLGKCGHHVRLAPATVDQFADDVRLSDLEARMTCSKCGYRAEVRPDFDLPAMETGGRR